MRKKEKTILLISLVVVIILTIILITYLQNNNGNGPNGDEEVMQCIADNSKVYVTKTCSVCSSQKAILGDYLDLFDIVDCSDGTQTALCIDAGITHVPTWLINGEYSTGKKTIEELKQLTGCE